MNATGPWVARTQETILRQKPGTGVRLVKGSHIVVPRLHAHDRAYLLPNNDGRLSWVGDGAVSRPIRLARFAAALAFLARSR